MSRIEVFREIRRIFLDLTLTLDASIMKVPQVGRAIAALRCRGRGKSALYRAQRRRAPGAGKPPRGVNLPERATETNRYPARGGKGEKVV